MIHQQPLKVTSGVFDNLEKLRPYGFGSGARSKTGTPSIIAIGWLQHFDINSEGFEEFLVNAGLHVIVTKEYKKMTVIFHFIH